MDPSSRPLSLASLPPETLHQILEYLPIPSLLSFSQASKRYHRIATSALHTLHLAVLPRRIYGVLAFLNSLSLDDLDISDSVGRSCALDQIIVTSKIESPNAELSNKNARRSSDLNISPADYRDQLFTLHNALACKVLSTPALSSLQTLTLHLYHLSSPALARILATSLPHLRHLNLNFFHPYIHDTCLPAHYWSSSVFLKGSPVWNSLAGLGVEHAANLSLRNLESLTLARVGITSAQLRRWIQNNPNLKQLAFRNVTGVDQEFVEWLGTYYNSQNHNRHVPRIARLTVLILEHCSSLKLKSVEDFYWLDNLFEILPSSKNNGSVLGTAGLDVLSLQTHGAISTANFLAYLELRKPAIEQVTVPDGRVFVAKPTTPPNQKSDLSPPLLHHTGSRQNSSQSLNNLPEQNTHQDWSGDNQPLSFLCQSYSEAFAWSSLHGGTPRPGGLSVTHPFHDGNSIIEVDEAEVSNSAAYQADNRLIRPIVRRLRK
ncbi:hypothetical protein B0A52_00254 [Exophiala mesophila]|uniref:F-box domain-containing protein n=1 Tax=Exophiala mesophila TaxID=212818 RepID=A0A438NJI3_EXOME|nr:hypothetical protein B0A52_00254 [Exophiala mesophila]